MIRTTNVLAIALARRDMTKIRRQLRNKALSICLRRLAEALLKQRSRCRG